MVTPRDRLSVAVNGDEDWYASPEGEAYYSREDPERAEPHNWTPYPKKGTGMGRVGPGFRRERKIFKLRFTDPDMEGLVVRTRSASVQQFLDIQTMAEAAADKDGDTVASMRALLAAFATVIIDWNLEEEDGTPIPPTPEAMLDEDFDFVMTMVKSWIDAVTGVAEPVGKESTPGSPLLEGSLQMETLSPSLAS